MSSAKVIKNKNEANGWISGLSFKQLPKIKDVAFILDDERIVYIPLSWSKKLQKAKPRQRQNFKNSGIHIFWDDVDEIIGVKNILFGKELFV